MAGKAAWTTQMINTLLTVMVLHWAILITPGANVLVVMQLAASGDRRAAIGAACGVVTVAVIWAVLAVLGLHAVFEAHAGLRQVVQALGGLYLIHVAVRLWRSRTTQGVEQPHVASGFGGYKLGFMTNILNPKSALFFGSVFATALPPDPGVPLMTMAVLLVLVNALVWHIGLAFTFSLPGARSRYARHGRLMNRTSSVAVGFFGVSMLVGSFNDYFLRPSARGS
jgi:threonine efflux protein